MSQSDSQPSKNKIIISNFSQGTRITPQKRVILQLLFFILGFVLVVCLQAGFNYFMSQAEQKIENQQSLRQLGEYIYQDLLSVEKDVYLLPITHSVQEQLDIRRRISLTLSSTKTKLAILRWGGAFSASSISAEFNYIPVHSNQKQISKILELTPQIEQLEQQIAYLSLLLIQDFRKSNTTYKKLAEREQTLANLQSLFVLVHENIQPFVNYIQTYLNELNVKTKSQSQVNSILHPLLSILILMVVMAMGYRIAKQVGQEDQKLQLLIKDLEAARESERELGKSKANFLSTISHEILTPINAVVGLVSLLLNSKLNTEQNRYAKSIKDSSDQLLSIVNDILDFYKLDSGQFSFDHIEFDLQTLIESIYEIISAKALKKKLKVGYFIQSEVKSIFKGDPAKIRQILINFLTNAIKFTPNGGIVLEVKSVNRQAQNEKIRFEVHDSGIGISEKAKSELFNSFTQIDDGLSRQYGGTGLGLAISKHIVELLDGDIGVESESNQGSTFWFELPLQRLTPPNSKTNYIEEEKFDRQEVLYIDDLPLNRALNIKKMQYWNLQPIAKNNTADGFKELWKNKINGKSNYVVFIDFAAESDEQTFDFVHQVKAEASFKSIPIIFTTNRGFKQIERFLPNYREDRVTPLIKPYRNDQLLTALSNAFAKMNGTEEEISVVDEYLHQIKNLPTKSKKKRLTVLVVDDNSINQMVAKGYLKQKGHRVDFADNGKQALEQIMHNHYDLILMDLQMPIMDGITATRAIRALTQEDKNSIPIVAMTANALAEERKACFQAGMNDFLSKPIDKTMLEVVLAGDFETLPRDAPLKENLSEHTISNQRMPS